MAEWKRRAVPIKALQCALLAVLVVTMLGANESRVERLGHEMICTCGCSQILMECNHVGCPVSPVMISELKDQVAAGGVDTKVLNWFAAKYGSIVLAAPIRGGFDNVAWIMPIAVFILATVGTAGVVWFWRRRTLRLSPGGTGVLESGYFPAQGEDREGDALRERIRRETEYR